MNDNNNWTWVAFSSTDNLIDKWRLVEQSFGMWEDYPEDWLQRMRSGLWKPPDCRIPRKDT